MKYLTWRELRDKLIEIKEDQILDEPALFAYLDNYSTETLFPIQLIQDTWHPNDKPSCVVYNEVTEQFDRQSDIGEEDIIPLRQLPPNALLLAYSEMDEDLEETKDWLQIA